MILQPNLTGKISTELRKAWQLMASVVNGHISFGDSTKPGNIDGVWVPISTTGANQSVTHNLGRVPVGYFIVKKDAAVDIFTGTGVWTSSVMFLNSSVGGASVSLFVF